MSGAATALLFAAALASGAVGDSRVATGGLELEGPLDQVVLEAGPSGSTRLELGLVAGERRRLEVPVPIPAALGLGGLDELSAPIVRATGAGRASWTGWSEEQPAERIARLPAGLRARSRPAAGEARARADRGTLALALALGLLGLGLRRRPAAALLLGVVGAATLGPLAARAPRPAEPVRLLEFEGGRAGGLRVVAARGECEELGGALEVEPEHSVLALELALVGDRLRGRVRAPGARLVALVPTPAEPPRAEANGLGRLERTWVRGPDGGWSDHGAWPAGAPLPPATRIGVQGQGARAGPPGWLVTGLPPGRSVLVGRLAPGAEADWVRVVGFESAR